MVRRGTDSHSLISQQTFLYSEPVISSITFLKNKPLRQPRLCKGITLIDLLGTKRMRVGTTTRNLSQLVPSVAHMLTSRLHYWLISGLGSQEAMGRRY
jgi:hypothetical protein